MWIYTSTPPYAFMAYAYLVRHRDNFTFLPNPSALGSTQPLTGMSTRNLLGGEYRADGAYG
jgi:hypothetical protein